MRNKFLLLSLGFMLLLSGCKEKKRFNINVNGNNKVEVKINRFDRDFLSIDTTNIIKEVTNLYKTYPDFFPVYVTQVLDILPEDTIELCNLVGNFLSDTTFTSINQKVLNDFSNIQDIETKVSTAYTYIHHYFPEIHLPKVYFYVSGLNLSIMMRENFIGLGADMYLGSDFPPYADLTYQYMLQNMNRENMAPDMVSAFLFSHFPMYTNNTDIFHERLLDHMLYRGKVMYLLSICMTEEREEYLIGYTSEQLKWSYRYEHEIWASIIEKQHLFSTDNFLIRKYVNDAPFTSPISQESPGRLGTWIGWQIVKSYMDRNKEVSLKELMNNNDYQKILEDSGYRP